MTAKEFLTSKKVFHGLGVEEDNTTGNSHKIADLMEEYHQAKLKELGIPHVVGRSEQLKCPTCELDYDKEEIEIFRGLCESCRDRIF